MEWDNGCKMNRTEPLTEFNRKLAVLLSGSRNTSSCPKRTSRSCSASLGSRRRRQRTTNVARLRRQPERGPGRQQRLPLFLFNPLSFLSPPHPLPGVVVFLRIFIRCPCTHVPCCTHYKP